MALAPFTGTQSTASATDDGDPVPGCDSTAGKGVWFKVTLPYSGIFTVDTAGSSFRTVLAIYSGTCGALTSVACNAGVGTPLLWSSNRVHLTAAPYYPPAAGHDRSGGSLQINSNFSPDAAPTVSSISADDIGPRAATLRANINPGNLPTTAWYLFGTDPGTLWPLPEQFDQSGGPYTLTTPLRGLLPGTTYHFSVIATNSMGEFHSSLQTFTTPENSAIEATFPRDLISGTSTNWPAAEPPSSAIDNTAATKYLNFDRFNAGLIVTPSGEGPVRALTLISANDEPARDPSSFVLEGSQDGVTFTQIASNAVPMFPGRHTIQTLPIASWDIYLVYRLTFPTVADAVRANSAQIAEIELNYGNQITSPNDSWTVSLPEGASDVRGIGSLIDNNLGSTNKLEIAPILYGNTIVTITPAAGDSLLRGFELIGAADDMVYPDRRPSFVVLEGSRNGNNFTTLATVVPAAATANLQIQEFAVTDALPCQSYRVTFGPPVSGDRLQVGELRLFGERATKRVATQPTLELSMHGSDLLVRWPDAPGFNLETKTALNDADWTPVGVTPVLSNGTNTVTLPMTETTGFFRLRQ
jgi:hypothetical protein